MFKIDSRDTTLQEYGVKLSVTASRRNALDLSSNLCSIPTLLLHSGSCIRISEYHAVYTGILYTLQKSDIQSHHCLACSVRGRG